MIRCVPWIMNNLRKLRFLRFFCEPLVCVGDWEPTRFSNQRDGSERRLGADTVL
jgi:hypothetical protein